MQPRRRLLVSVPFVVSVLVLAVNDHVAKSAIPGLVTGKLSDVAGVAMMAIAATAFWRRRIIGIGATAIGFSALKTVPAVAAAAAPVLGGTTRTDVTDLFALAVLIPLWRWVGRPSASPSASGSSASGTSASGTSAAQHAGGAAWLFPLQIVAISAAVLATTATSCEGEGVLDVTAVDGVVFATTVGDVYESFDGGLSWRPSEVPSWDESLDRPYPETRSDCVAPERCFEISGPGGAADAAVSIDAVGNGDRRSILSVSTAQLQSLTTVVKAQCGDGFFDSIAAVDRPDGVHVVVSMGAAGVLHHRPDQTWEWVAVGSYGLRQGQVDEEPFGFGAASTIATDGWERWPFELVGALLLLAPLAVASAIVPIVRLARRGRRDPALGIITCAVVAVLLAGVSLFAFVFGTGFGNRGGAAMASAFVAAVAVCTVAPLLAWYGRRRRPAGWLPPQPSDRAG